MTKDCHCIIRHANTEAERTAVRKALEQARKNHDSTGVTVALAQLSGRCPARGNVESLAVRRGRKQITAHPDGAITVEGPAGVNLFRLLVVKKGMELEYLSGMKLTSKAPSCFVIARREHGLKGNKVAIYLAFCERHGFSPNERMLDKIAKEKKS